MHLIFDEALIHAASLLRELPCGRGDVQEARTQLERFRVVHPGIRTDLLVDEPQTSLRVEYDVLLGHPDGGTIALTWHADNGVPWFVQYADHWAANYVVTVNGGHLTVQQALLSLKLEGRQYPDLMTQLVDQQLISEAIEKDPLSLNAAQLQAAADEFRNATGLYTADETRRWLEETGLSLTKFQELLRGTIQTRRLKDRVTQDCIEPYFEAHREDFDLIQFFRVETPMEAVAANLASGARGQGLLMEMHTNAMKIVGKDFEAVLRSQHACELPSVLASAIPAEVVGPVAESGRYWVAEILYRQPSQLDARTRAAIQERLFREWLTDQRKQATVRWHWL